MYTLLAPNSPSSPRTCPCETCKKWRLAHPAPQPRPAEVQPVTSEAIAEQAKIDVAEGGETRVDMGHVERGLAVTPGAAAGNGGATAATVG